MRQRMLRVALLGLFLTMLTAGSAFASPSNAFSNTRTRTSSGSEIIPVSADLCANLKAAYPTHAQDPKLCQTIHNWTVNVTDESVASSASSSCPSGTATYHDQLTQQEGFWVLDQNTTFKWQGNCYYPVLTWQQCYVEETVNTTVTNQRCYSYHYYGSGWESTAAVYTGYMTTTIGPIVVSSWNSQRRECYNYYVADCNWTGWEGQ